MKISKSQDTLNQLRAKHPDWYIWYTVAAFGRVVWHAGRPSNMVATYEAQSADELDADLSGDTVLRIPFPRL